MLFFSVLQMFTSVRVLRLSNANLTNQGLNKIFTDLCENLLKVKTFWCWIFKYATLCCYAYPWAWSFFRLHSAVLLRVVVFWIRSCNVQFIMCVSEFLLQVALYDPLLSLSSQIHCSCARRRTHTGEKSPTCLPWFVKSKDRTDSKMYNFSFLHVPPRSQWQQLLWRLTRTRLKRGQQRRPSAKVCLIKAHPFKKVS